MKNLLMRTKTKELINVLNLLSLFKNLMMTEKERKKQRVFDLWAELEACEKAYKHKKSLGDQLLAKAADVENMELSFNEKISRKEIYIQAARDNFDKADAYNERINDLSEELRLAMK